MGKKKGIETRGRAQCESVGKLAWVEGMMEIIMEESAEQMCVWLRGWHRLWDARLRFWFLLGSGVFKAQFLLLRSAVFRSHRRLIL
jgi:hypothetical protein